MVRVVADTTETARRAIAELEQVGLTVVLDGPRFALHAGPFDSMPELLAHLYDNGWRVGAAPLCPICGAVRKSCEPGSHGDQGSMGGTPGPLGAGEASGVSPSRLRVVP